MPFPFGGYAFGLADRVGLWTIYREATARFWPRALILMYHRVGDGAAPATYPPVPVSAFEAQMRYLRRHYRVLPLEDIASLLSTEKPLKEPVAAVTFDDGYRDNYTSAFPVLARYGIPATVFLATGFIGGDRAFWWDEVGVVVAAALAGRWSTGEFGALSTETPIDRERTRVSVFQRIKESPAGERAQLIAALGDALGTGTPQELGQNLILSWDEVREMHEAGISMGAHTVSHPILSRIPPGLARAEILGSKEAIEHRLGTPVASFSYPNGKAEDYDAAAVAAVRDAGFAAAVTTIPGSARTGCSPVELPRVTPGRDPRSFDSIASGFYPDLCTLMRR
jgi:peptidoglycan/xylan/chitin deacetylase (PgdA/CDA1 family)